jgi:hypothetical protein
MVAVNLKRLSNDRFSGLEAIDSRTGIMRALGDGVSGSEHEQKDS